MKLGHEPDIVWYDSFDCHRDVKCWNSYKRLALRNSHLSWVELKHLWRHNEAALYGMILVVELKWLTVFHHKVYSWELLLLLSCLYLEDKHHSLLRLQSIINDPLCPFGAYNAQASRRRGINQLNVCRGHIHLITIPIYYLFQKDMQVIKLLLLYRFNSDFHRINVGNFQTSLFSIIDGNIVKV